MEGISKNIMKKIDFEKILSLISSDLYSFGYALIPDDLQAGQLSVDAITAYLVSKKIVLEQLLNTNTDTLKNEIPKIKMDLLKVIYDLAKKRFYQVRVSIESEHLNDGFYHLEFDEKAALYLKDKMKLSNDEISVVTMRSRAEVLASLYSGRLKMVKALPFEVLEESLA